MIDLHTHTTHSDGKQTVSQLLKKAEQQNLKIISITDHQSVGAYTELRDPKIRALFSGKIITGVELNFQHNGLQNEILGYGIDPEKLNANTEINMMTKEKFDEALAMYHKVTAGITDKAERLLTWQAYISNQKIDSLHAVSKAIRDAGGKAFMAHIFRTIKHDDAVALLDYCVEHKLIDGIEVYYRDHDIPFSKEQVEFLEKYCKKHGLLASGGSDNHRPERPLATDIPQKAVAWL